MKKSPAENEKGQSVEDIFRNGFSDAESAPPSRIWESIDRELENHDLQRYRRQVVWYRSLAAAFLLLLISAGIVLWQQNSESTGIGQQAGTLATLQTSKDKTPAIGPASEKPVATSVGKSVGTVQEKSREDNGQIASVSSRFSENQLQSRVSSKPLGLDARNSLGTSNSSVPAEEGKIEEGLVALQKVKPTPPATEVLPESTPIAPAKAPVESTPFGNSFTQKGAEKPFTRSLATNLPLLRNLPIGVDSLAKASQRSILAQKEASVAGVAQTQPAKKGNEADDADVYRWSVTMAYSPQYAYAPVKIGNNSSMNDAAIGQSQVYQQYQQAIEEYNESYTPTYSYSALVGASYRINDKWQVETGVLYTQNEAMTTQSYLVYPGGYLPSSTTGYANELDGKSAPLVTNAFRDESKAQPVVVNRTSQYNTKYRYQQVGLPLRLAYRVNIKRAYALFSGGVNMNLLVQNSIVPETDQVTAVSYGLNDKDSPYRTLQWATTTSIGVGYDVTKKMSVLIAPEFTYSLTPLVREEQQQVNPYQLGVSIGGRWRLTK